MMMMNRDVSDTATPLNQEHEEIHVEIEQVPEENGMDSDDQNVVGVDITTTQPSQPYSSPAFSAGGSNGRVQLYTRVQGKRTVILPHQRKILEEFYRTGMTSASYNLHHLHEAAADQTGLELYVIKNWVRNRRRPAIPKRQDEPHQIPNPLPSPVSLIQSNIALPVTTVTIPPPPQQILHSAPPITMSEPKRPCFDNSDIGSGAILVKVRISDSGETDFVEVDVKEMTYSCLLNSCCEELEVSVEEVAKLRKLPDVLIRKDRDVLRLRDRQELELVLKPQGGGSSLAQTFMALNSSSSVQLMNVNPLINSDNALLTLDNHHNAT